MDSEDLQDTTTQHENMSIWPALRVARIHQFHAIIQEPILFLAKTRL